MTKPVRKNKTRQTSSRKFRTSKTRKQRAARRALYNRLASTLATSALMLVGAALILFALGFHTLILEHFVPQPAKPASANGPVTNVIPAVSDTCGGARQSDPQFATCPSFLALYANRQAGSINPQLFNIYTGAPVANGEAQYYSNDTSNLRVADGSLVLEARAQPYQGYSYTSARIDTKGKEDFLYGKLFVRAQLPGGAGTWPAIWMLPSQPRYASYSPASDRLRYQNDGEIDIAEAIGLEPHVVYGVAHSLAYPEDGTNHTYFNTTLVPDNDRSFHDYEVDWTPTSLTYRIDGRAFFTYHKQAGADWRSWPFDQPFYLIINLALGGTWAGRDVADFPGSGVDARALPASLRVQSIRYYSYTAAH